MNIDGTVEEASASYIIRDFETESFEKRKDLMKSIADQMNAELGSEAFSSPSKISTIT